MGGGVGGLGREEVLRVWSKRRRRILSNSRYISSVAPSSFKSTHYPIATKKPRFYQPITIFQPITILRPSHSCTTLLSEPNPILCRKPDFTIQHLAPTPPWYHYIPTPPPPPLPSFLSSLPPFLPPIIPSPRLPIPIPSHSHPIPTPPPT